MEKLIADFVKTTAELSEPFEINRASALVLEKASRRDKEVAFRQIV